MNREKVKRFWTEGTGSFILAIGIALLIRWAFMEAYVIPSGSMLPTLLVNDHIFVNKIVYGVRVPFTTQWLAQFSEPRRGEIIVFKYPLDLNLYYIKRVVGTPGDRVLYEKGNLYVNEELVERSVPAGDLKEEWDWLSDQDFRGELNALGLNNYTHWQESLGDHSYSVLLRKEGSRQVEFGPYVVPEGHFFVMGDNRDNSQDSRFWSPNATKSNGEITFSLQGSSSEPVILPKGTIVSTKEQLGSSVRFKTLSEVKVTNQPVTVPAEAIALGPDSNVPMGSVVELHGEYGDVGIKLSNNLPFQGGIDKRFVPRENVVGRAMFVWLSCEETLPVVTFLCNPLEIRWGRFFESVH